MANEKRLIDANKLKGIIQEAIEESDYQLFIDVMREICDVLDKSPTVDAVEVVRCCDCKYGIWDDEEAMWKCVYSAEFDEGISEWLGFCDYNDGNHFCSYGERRNDER